jgi:formylglycine-generating enzyme required for sulfatase activity
VKQRLGAPTSFSLSCTSTFQHLEDSGRRQNDAVLSLIAKRQYVDWRKWRHRDVRTTDVSEEVERFCTHIRDALHRPWVSPEERKQQEEAAARQKSEAERRHQEAEAKRRAEEKARQRTVDEDRRQREAEAQRNRNAALEAKAREDEQLRKHEAEAEQKTAEAERRRAEERRLREEAKEKRRAEAEEHRRLQRSQARPLWPPTRPVLTVASFLGVVLLSAIGVWLAESPTFVPANAPLSAEQERALKPRDTFQECTNCPLMVVVPAGSFSMGSPASEPGRQTDEGPQHVVTLARPFAAGQFELTFDEWDACAADGGCDALSDNGWGRGSRPAIGMLWYEAKAYVAWLAKKTGKTYRLLTEAEFEYATRAGTTTAYPWGDAIGTNKANCEGCGSKWDSKQTAPVGSFAPNQFGLYDMVGNVWEWTEDCHRYTVGSSYDGAPADGSAWTSGTCVMRIMRGGSWETGPQFLRSASRWGLASNGFDLGFRVARTLSP